jgi:tubulin polyglutamylase TTLL11
MKNMYMHLTNYSLNKNSEKFKLAGQDFADVNSNAHKQLLTSVFKKLQQKGRDVRILKS